MTEDLLPYYNRELAYIRRLAADFADAHPKIAKRLRLSADAVEDPHVARLIEAFAFLTARVRLKLDDEFPELTEALLGVLYPHYLAPIPSAAILQMACQPDLGGSFIVPAGTEVDSEPVGGESCRFRTCYDTTLWPILLESAKLTGRPIVAPANPRATGAVAALRLTLRCLAPETTFTQLAPDSLRFFLRGQPQEVFPLYELIFNNCLGIALADSANDPHAVLLPPEALTPIGFAHDEGLLPYPGRSFHGYRLLTEYFAFPEKFLFFEVTRLSGKTLLQAGNRLEIFLYLNHTSVDLERSLTAANFALGCTPAVNLFSQRAEPIYVTHQTTEYRIIADARRPAATEVYSVDGVTGTSPDGSETAYAPFFSIRHAGHDDDDDEAPRRYWHAARRDAEPGDQGSEVFLSLVDLGFDPAQPAQQTLSVDITCLSRDLPASLPFGGGHPTMTLVEPATPVASLACLTPPTPTLRLAQREQRLWRLISHLSLNHLSLQGEEATPALREILRLYDFRESAETRAIIDSIVSVSGKPAVARAPAGGAIGFCRGIDVTVEFQERHFSGSGVFLLAAVLERFLAHYCSINAFTRLTVRLKGRTGDLRKWHPRAGDRVLL